ncbi:MAG: hypothetical protein U9N34_11390 [Candidatus Cloacimonadota bacterium]|nr:hypothetical protein [Candidatus Cloacimonadota bacterium]
MYIDKLSNLTEATNSVANDKVNQNSKIDKQSSKTDKEAKSEKNSDVLKFSSKAKKLQESESILRKALQKIESFEQIRNEDLSEVSKRIDSDYYNSDEFAEELSRKIFSDNDLENIVSEKKAIRNLTKKLEEANNSEEIDEQKMKDIREKIENGFYNNPDILSNTADKIINLIN